MSSSVACVPALDLTMHVYPVRSARGCAVIVPGFLDPGEGPATSVLARALPLLGLTTVTFDPRGTWASPGLPEDLSPSVQLDDLAALVDRFAVRDQVLLVGYSYGGYLASLAAARDERVTDVVALMPTRCFIWPEDYDARKDTWRAAGERTFHHGSGDAEREFRVPYTVVKDSLGHDLPAALGHLTQRVLFVVGEHDTYVRPDRVRQLYDECGSPDKRLAVLPGVQHDFRDHADQIETVTRTVLEWVSRG